MYNIIYIYIYGYLYRYIYTYIIECNSVPWEYPLSAVESQAPSLSHLHRPVQQQAVFAAGRWCQTPTRHRDDLRGHTVGSPRPWEEISGILDEFAGMCSWIFMEFI